MRMTKSDLKALVKECLVEILSEGLGNLQSTVKNQPIIPKANFVESSKRHSDVVASSHRQASAHLKETIRREAGGNKIMESILADTASSTLPKMMQNEGRQQPVPGGRVEQIVASVNPEDLFGDEAASKWADLAFMSPSTKK